ncbi:MAG: hypothetical protein WBO15_14195, partial [Gammaproteobacteria bacterium]
MDRGLVASARGRQNDTEAEGSSCSPLIVVTDPHMFKALIDVTYRQARRLVIFVVGMSLVLA